MPFEFKHKRLVAFSDTDMAGIMHFSRFMIFMESAEHAFFRSLGYSIHTTIDDRTYGWPRLEVGCRFKAPLFFEDEVEIHLLVREVTDKTISYTFIFRKRDAARPVVVAEGNLSVICVTRETPEGRMRATRIPGEIASQLQAAPDNLLRDGEV